MSERNLKRKLIRLAYQNPELRSDLLPLIQKTAYWKPPRRLTKTFAKQVAKYIQNTMGSKHWSGGVNGNEELKLQDVRNGIATTILLKMSMSDMMSYQSEVKRWVDSLPDDDLRTLVVWVYDVWYKGRTHGYGVDPQRIKSAYGMKSVAKFYTFAEAVAFVESYKHDNVRIEKELDGRFHVYDMK